MKFAKFAEGARDSGMSISTSMYSQKFSMGQTKCMHASTGEWQICRQLGRRIANRELAYRLENYPGTCRDLRLAASVAGA